MGGSFSECYATPAGTNVAGSKDVWQTIYKRNSDGSAALGGFAGIEFAISFDSKARTLTFGYAPQAGDPEIRAIVVSQASKGVLFYDADSPITSFTFAMTDLFGTNGGGWSHLTFFGSAAPVTLPTAVPAPAVLPVMGAALLCLALVRLPRRREAVA